MAVKKNLLQKLLNLEGAIKGQSNPHADVIRSPSPSFNFIFGKGHGLPRGFSALLYGPYKCGKTLMSNAMVGQLHQDDPDAVVIKFDTEFRETGQMNDKIAHSYGIDRDRYIVYQTNEPAHVFDRIEKEIPAMIDEGLKIPLIIIDSITGIRGRRAMNAESVDKMQIGDHAQTIQDGLKRIIGVQRKYGIALILTCQVRAEMDQVEVMRGNKYKPSVSFAAKHHCEYFINMEQDRTKAGREDLLGNKFEDESRKDMDGKAEIIGHKIWSKMADSSVGPKGRAGEFTIEYENGIVNVHEEVFMLGVNQGIIERVNNTTYGFDGLEWRGKPALLEALKNDRDLQKKILTELKRRDLEGTLSVVDEDKVKDIIKE